MYKNEHHPQDSRRGLAYSLKYALKPEPQTKMAVQHGSDDSVMQFFKGQFVALAAAVKVILGDPVTESTREDCPLAYPSWTPVSSPRTQGLWARYTLRFPLDGVLNARDGYNYRVDGMYVALSVLFALFQRFVRYFNKD